MMGHTQVTKLFSSLDNRTALCLKLELDKLTDDVN